MSSTSTDQQGMELAEMFLEFYRDYYAEEIAHLAQRFPRDEQSLYIEARDLYHYNPDLYDDWLANPDDIQGYAEDALARYDLPVDIDLSGATVRLTDTEGTMQARPVTTIEPEDIGRYVALSGKLSRITQKRPRLVAAAYECERCGTISEVPQTRASVQEPHSCHGCDREGPFMLNDRKSTFVNQRKVKLEEPIEERSQPRGDSAPVFVESDLCDYGPGETILPDHAGEQATVMGIVRTDKSQLHSRNADGETEYWLDARAIVFEADDASDIDIEAHREDFETFAAREDAVDLVAESLAPELHASEGHDLYTVRRACAAWLFNAYRINPSDGGSKRGDLHMCLIGDPGTGKSTLMGYLHDVLPKSEFRTGTGLTKVGLTAAAVQEEFAGKSEWTLQPGILPRANGGHCIIDEVDGVVDENTKAIHDALEGEQMVKADKAGIQADLPTRCALLAGGNPTDTRFNTFEAVTEQIDLDPALFDRMDLVFTLMDEVDEDSDREKAGHMLDAWDDLARREEQPDDESDDRTIDPPVSQDVLRAWVAHARRNVYPDPPDGEVKEALREFYVEVRDLNDSYEGEDSDGDTPVPATPRTLEASVRLSIAFARLRLSETVEMQDAERAIDLTKNVVGLRFDPATGQFDDQRTGKGVPQSAKHRRDALAKLVGELAGDEPVTAETVIDTATERFNAAESTIRDDLQKLQRERGAIYEPDGHGNGYRRTG